jgi:hypothetical protein
MAAVGEVLSSSITEVVVACWQPDEDEQAPDAVPAFGSFLCIDSSEQGLKIFASVFDVVTGPLDGLHKAQPLKMSRKQLRLEQPQIFSLLKTDLKAAIVGYERKGVYHAGLAPLPCQVHDFVSAAEPQQIERVTDGLEFIRLLSRISSVPNDELVTAAIWQAYRARKFSYEFLVEAGQTLAKTFGDDYNRLSAALAKLQASSKQTVR